MLTLEFPAPPPLHSPLSLLTNSATCNLIVTLSLSLCLSVSDYARKKKVAFKNLVAKGKIPLPFMICV